MKIIFAILLICVSYLFYVTDFPFASVVFLIAAGIYLQSTIKGFFPK
jgi:hypothetical protein